MARKLKKRLNGQGNSITLNFNANDPQEAAALAMSKRLAGMKKGKRKDFIIAMLAAAEQIYQETGQLIETYEIASAIMGSRNSVKHQVLDFAVAGQPNSLALNSEMISRTGQQRYHSHGVEITASDSKASAESVAKNFLNSMKGMASGFFD